MIDPIGTQAQIAFETMKRDDEYCKDKLMLLLDIVSHLKTMHAKGSKNSPRLRERRHGRQGDATAFYGVSRAPGRPAARSGNSLGLFQREAPFLAVL